MKRNGHEWLAVPAVLFLSALLPEYFSPAPLIVATGLYFRDIRRGDRPCVYGVGTPFLVYILWMAIGLIYSKNRLQGFAFVLMWLAFFMGYVCVTKYIDRRERLDAAIYACALSGGAVGAVGVLQIILFHYGKHISYALTYCLNPFWRMLNEAIAKLALNTILPDFITRVIPRTEFITIEDRANSTFTNPLLFAAFLIMMMPFAAYCMFYGQTKKKRVIGLLCFLLTVGGIAASYSRGPYIAAVITVLVLLFYGGKKTLVLVGISGGSLGIMGIVSPGVFKRFLTLASNSDKSISTREVIYDTFYKLMHNNWLFGLGTSNKNFRDVLIEQTGVNQPHAHNLFFEIMVENGVIGLILFAIPIIMLAVCIIKLYKNKGSRPLAVTLCASIAGLMMCGVTDYIFYGLKLLMYFMLIFGLAESARRIYVLNSKGE